MVLLLTLQKLLFNNFCSSGINNFQKFPFDIIRFHCNNHIQNPQQKKCIYVVVQGVVQNIKWKHVSLVDFVRKNVYSFYIFYTPGFAMETYFHC